MKIAIKSLKPLVTGCCLLAVALSAAAQTKKALVVTTTLGFRHSSIPTAEKVLAKLGDGSKVYTVEYARVEPKGEEFLNPDTKKVDNEKVKAAIKKVLAEKMNAEALNQYDAIIFANTTGDLPLPDKDAFLNWIKSGKAFVGMHSASDTFHGWPAFIDMIGGEFLTHGNQACVDCLNERPQHPANVQLGKSWRINKEEIYLFKNYDKTKVQDLLVLDKHPNKPEQAGHFPISWCKSYGKGRVFYTSLGHREDVWDDETPANFKRENPVDVAKSYQQHILGGIKWALGLAQEPPQESR